jgi:hypothetical protein
MAMLRLPEEILLPVFSSLPKAKRIQEFKSYDTLKSISLTCRAFSRLIEPILYGTVVLGGLRSQTHLILRTLLARGNLASKVKHLVLGHLASSDRR